MATIEDQIRDIRTAISQATQRTTRAQVERDAAQTRLDEATRTLQEEFGIKTKDDARAQLVELQKQLQDEIAKAEAQLAEADA
jgi:hypothetical protein